MATDPRDDLVKQIRSIRRRINPDVLTQAAAAASTTDAAKAVGVEPEPAPAARAKASEIKLDMSWAKQAVELFLRSRNDGGRFAMQLMEKMRSPEEVARAYSGGDDPQKPRPRVYRKLS